MNWVQLPRASYIPYSRSAIGEEYTGVVARHGPGKVFFFIDSPVAHSLGSDGVFAMPSSLKGSPMPEIGTSVVFSLKVDAKTGRQRADCVKIKQAAYQTQAIQQVAYQVQAIQQAAYQGRRRIFRRRISRRRI